MAEALAPVISRNLYPDTDSGGAETALAHYMAEQAATLAQTDAEAITRHAKVFEGDLLEERTHGV